jgi:hypothetical protein
MLEERLVVNRFGKTRHSPIVAVAAARGEADR